MKQISGEARLDRDLAFYRKHNFYSFAEIFYQSMIGFTDSDPLPKMSKRQKDMYAYAGYVAHLADFDRPVNKAYKVKST